MTFSIKDGRNFSTHYKHKCSNFAVAANSGSCKGFFLIMNSEPSTIILPVENQVRELDAKILLAAMAAERGFPVIMGSRAFLHFFVDRVPRGVYMAKSMRKLSIKMFSILKQLGYEIVAWDEEGLVRWPDQEYWRWRLSPVTMSMVSHLLAWGEDDASWFRNYPGYPGTPIHITGNPRIDLLRSELREFYGAKALKLKEKYGKFVLINTNFSKVNHFFQHLSELKKAIKESEPGKSETFDAGKGRLKEQLFAEFKKMLPGLAAALPEHNIIVRPHPAENHEPWLKVAGQHRNIQVINEDTVTPWLMATDLLIANGCTTMIEAAVLDTPTIAYQPVADPRYDDDLPNAVSRRAFSPEELFDLSEKIMKGQLGPLPLEKRRSVLDRHIAALDGQLAAERIVDVLVDAGYLTKRPEAAPLITFYRGVLRNRIRTLVKKRNMHKPGHRNNIKYHDHRFPGTSTEEISSKIRQLGELLGGRFGDVHVVQLQKHIFKISTIEKHWRN